MSGETLQIGSVIKLRQWGGEITTGTITGKGFHKGLPCLDYLDPEGRERWCYLNQVLAVVS